MKKYNDWKILSIALIVIIGFLAYCLLFGTLTKKCEISNTTATNDSYDLFYIKQCMNNVDKLYKNNSIQRLKMADSCLREYATLNKIKIQNCLNLTFVNGTTGYYCGFATLNLSMSELINNNVSSVFFYLRYKDKSNTTVSK